MKIFVDGIFAASVAVTKKANSRLIVPQDINEWMAAYRRIFPFANITTESETDYWRQRFEEEEED